MSIQTEIPTVIASPETTASAATVRTSLRYSWYVVFVLMLCYTLSFIDRQILSLLVAPIKRDLGISDTRIGLLQGLAFALFFTVMGLPMGRIADTHSRRLLAGLGLVCWSVMTAVCGVAKSFWSLFLARMGVGVGEATLNPSAFSLITDYFPRERLGTALSVYSMGIFIGSGLALVIGGMVVDAVAQLPATTLPVLGSVASWRLTFLMVGLPGILVAIFIFSLREPIRRNLLRGDDGHVSALSVSDVIVQLRLRWQSVIGLSLGTAFQSMCVYALTAWAPTFFLRVHGWKPGKTGLCLGVIILSVGCLGIYAGGKLCDRWLQQGIHEAPLRVGVVSAAGIFLSFTIATNLSQPLWTLALFVPGFFSLGLPIGSSFAALQLIFHNQLRGQVGALLVFILNMGGLTLGPLLPGLFNDYLFRNGNMVGASIALTVGIASLLMGCLLRATYAPYRIHYRMMHNCE